MTPVSKAAPAAGDCEERPISVCSFVPDDDVDNDEDEGEGKDASDAVPGVLLCVWWWV